MDPAHYSTDPLEPVYFYGGIASSFAAWPIFAKSLPPIQAGALRFPTREHWFAAHKTLNVGDFTTIATAKSPMAAKAMGRNVALRPGWDDGLAFATMVEGIRMQVQCHRVLREWLHGTAGRLIAEDSPTDYIWGIRDAAGGYTGRNMLGRAWMAVRAEL